MTELTDLEEKKYPHAAKFLKAHPQMTIDQAIAYFERLEATVKA